MRKKNVSELYSFGGTNCGLICLFSLRFNQIPVLGTFLFFNSAPRGVEERSNAPWGTKRATCSSVRMSFNRVPQLFYNDQLGVIFSFECTAIDLKKNTYLVSVEFPRCLNFAHQYLLIRYHCWCLWPLRKEYTVIMGIRL